MSSVYQNLLNFVEIWRSYDRNKYAQFFETRCTVYFTITKVNVSFNACTHHTSNGTDRTWSCLSADKSNTCSCVSSTSWTIYQRLHWFSVYRVKLPAEFCRNEALIWRSSVTSCDTVYRRSPELRARIDGFRHPIVGRVGEDGWRLSRRTRE